MSKLDTPPATSGEHYRKKPVVIRAKQWFKIGDHPNVTRAWSEGSDYRCPKCGRAWGEHGEITTLESKPDGAHHVCPADWIIRGVKGEFYACKPDIFAMTYEPASAVSEIEPRRTFEEWLEFYSPGALLSYSEGEIKPLRAAWFAAAAAYNTGGAQVSVPAGGQAAAGVSDDAGSTGGRSSSASSAIAAPEPVELVADPERDGMTMTGILVRAKTIEGKFDSLDIAELDRKSLHAWLRSRGEKNLWAENCIFALLGHEQIAEGA